jgi:hypothetical protein
MSLDAIKDWLSYDPETGELRWLRSPNNRVPAGAEAGGVTVRGGKSYRALAWKGRKLYAHRVAVFLMTGEWPAKLVDHHDGDGLNNRWVNIRTATGTQNCANSIKPSSNTSGYKGAYYDKRRQCFFAQIMVAGRQIYLGTASDVEDAAMMYDEAARKYFGEFAKLNFPEGDGYGRAA